MDGPLKDNAKRFAVVVQPDEGESWWQARARERLRGGAHIPAQRPPCRVFLADWKNLAALTAQAAPA